jgi:hypothetical protein
LVPTVVPCSRVTAAAFPAFFVALQIFRNASPIAREGSSGVENTFSVLRTPSSTHTQSVNVPPVSIAITRVKRTLLPAPFDLDLRPGKCADRIAERDAGCRTRAIKMEDYHCRQSPFPQATITPLLRCEFKCN